ncbi:hypothetical protein Slin15195_G083990 [Septoria linicola]|uniref:Uncharacterized protein n=1 Tax=Septoria linicola TaxID=215465 RepID=A0A9Q9ELH0_9PEZI|nr:hypothetical protein Slin15195_G083990 [Septoria linicola]
MEEEPLIAFTRGLAQPGKDGPFHFLEEYMGAQVQGQRGHKCILTGHGLVNTMKTMALKGLKEGRVYPPPPETDCHPPGCEFRHHMYRSVASQLKKRRYAGHLSDTMAQTLVKLHLQDMEFQRDMLTKLLETHGGLILQTSAILALEYNSSSASVELLVS